MRVDPNAMEIDLETQQFQELFFPRVSNVGRNDDPQPMEIDFITERYQAKFFS